MIGGLSIICGSNHLDTCHQFVVRDEGGTRILNVKIYDKLLDLVARDSTHLVGSSLKEILGCKRTLTSFN